MISRSLLVSLVAALMVLVPGTVWSGEASAPAPEAPPEAESVPDDGVRVAVLGYHELSAEAPETAMRIRTAKFRKQMEVIRQLGITVVSIEDFIAWKAGEKTIPQKSIVLTFDDGWKSVYTEAFPVLKEFGYPFTLFLYKDYIDGGGKALTTGMVKEMVEHGATIGSHSVSHPYPSAVKKEKAKGAASYEAYLRKELGESKRFLESNFAVRCHTYAFPGGFYTEEMLELGKELGYTHMFTVIPAKIRRGMPDLTLPRYVILGNHDKIFEFATTFRESQDGIAAPAGAIAGLTQETPYPVLPEAGAIINSRMPEISADLSAVPDLDPGSVSMHVSGFGEVPATFDAGSKVLRWQVNRRLRQPITQVSVSWKDAAGKAPETPLRWSFRIDRGAAYLPDAE